MTAKEQIEHEREALHTGFMMLKKQRWVVELTEYVLIWLFLVPYAISVNKLLIPHNIVGGGLTGLAEIIYFATHSFIPLWLSTLVLNAILLIIAVHTLGWRFCIRTIWGVLSLAFWLKVVSITEEPILSDPFMSCVVAGLICGASLGMVYLQNGSSGGTDIIAMIVNKYRRVSVGKALFVCDLIIIGSAWFLPNINTIEPLVMGLCFTFMCMISVDMVMNNARQSVHFFIFSMKHAEEIASAINREVNRGATLLQGVGGYSKKPIKVVTCIARKHESKQIFDLIKLIDPNAFVSQTVAQGVFGKGFDTVLNKKEQERAKMLEMAENAEDTPVDTSDVKLKETTIASR